MKGTGPYTSLVNPKISKSVKFMEEMFVLAYPNGKISVLRHYNQCYNFVRNATKFFIIQKCLLRCTG